MGNMVSTTVTGWLKISYILFEFVTLVVFFCPFFVYFCGCQNNNKSVALLFGMIQLNVGIDWVDKLMAQSLVFSFLQNIEQTFYCYFAKFLNLGKKHS